MGSSPVGFWQIPICNAALRVTIAVDPQSRIFYLRKFKVRIRRILLFAGFIPLFWVWSCGDSLFNFFFDVNRPFEIDVFLAICAKLST